MAAMSSWLPLFWFIAVLALIPLALWLLKRSPLQKAVLGVGSRVVANQYLGPGQRLLTVEVGEGGSRRWLLLGATAHHISLITELPAQDITPTATPSFAQLLRRAPKDGA
jgi:flagellar protein FliO/FliZ